MEEDADNLGYAFSVEQFWESQATVGRPGTAPAAPQPFHKTSLAAPLVQYLVFRPLLLVVVDPDIFSPNFVNQVLRFRSDI